MGKQVYYAYSDEEKRAIVGDVDEGELLEENMLEDAGGADGDGGAAAAGGTDEDVERAVAAAEAAMAESEGGKAGAGAGKKGAKGKDAAAAGAKALKPIIQRYKGLGEMNPDELRETTMDASKRILKQVRIEDAAEADKIFDMLMGTDVPARKSFITSNAKFADIDI